MPGHGTSAADDFGHQRPGSVSTRLREIAWRARERPEVAWTTLAHHVDETFLYEAFRRTRKDGAPGVDGETAATFRADLRTRLRDLLGRFKAGTYHAPPVRRAHIPKGDGSTTRPIGIPTFEDKVLQRAVAMVLEAVYEQDFHDCSFGFRPGRSAHQALQQLWDQLKVLGGGWVLDVDIKSFFDTIDPTHLRSFLDERIHDGVLRRALDKWLNAGVLEAGAVLHPDLGTPQGGVISPLLANIYLHKVLDEWFAREVRPRLKGRGFLVRYADDFVLVLEQEHDAHRVLAALRGRMSRYGLTLHPDKTRLVDFRRPEWRPREPEPGTFDLLGFTHYWGRSRRGYWVVMRKTASSRLQRALKRIKDWCRENRNQSKTEQHQHLTQALRGHDAYYGITGNWRALSSMRSQVERIWRKWLGRCSRKARKSWAQFKDFLGQFPLPRARIVHPSLGRQLQFPRTVM